MNVIALFPSCNIVRAKTALDRWRARGYLVGVWVEEKLALPPREEFAPDILVVAPSYPGYWQAANHLIKLADRAGAEIVIPIGDDMDPDPKQDAQEIARRFRDRFPDGFGVMQPTGDDLDGTERICGSPWLGFGWVRRAYGGTCALWPEYFHFFGDEELFNVAQHLGVLEQWKDVTQHHYHWVGGRAEMTGYQKDNSDRWWGHDKEIFLRRRAAGFPCSTPLPPYSLGLLDPSTYAQLRACQ